jgi:hypothetical protein
MENVLNFMEMSRYEPMRAVIEINEWCNLRIGFCKMSTGVTSIKPLNFKGHIYVETKPFCHQQCLSLIRILTRAGLFPLVLFLQDIHC